MGQITVGTMQEERVSWEESTRMELITLTFPREYQDTRFTI